MSVTGVTTTNTPYPSAATTVSPVAKDLQDLGKALQSGDLAGAQQSFAQLLQDRQNAGSTQAAGQSQGARPHHHHHHHGGSPVAGANQAQAQQSSTAQDSNQLAQVLLSQPANGVLMSDPGSATAGSLLG